MQHPLERLILMDKLFWWPEEKTDFRNYPELGFWVWAERQNWMTLPKTYRDSQAWRGLDGKWNDVSTLIIWVMNHSCSKGSWLLHQGRFTQTVTQAWMSQVHHCIAWTLLQWDTELTKLIPRSQHPKFLPLSHLVASICRWLNAKERKTACTYKSHPQHPVYKLREKAHEILFAQGFSMRAQKSFSTCQFMKQWLVTQTKGNWPCLIPTIKFSTTAGTFSGQAGGSETTWVELPCLHTVLLNFKLQCMKTS